MVNQGIERRRLSLEARRLQTIEAEAKRLAEEKALIEEVDRIKMAFLRQVTHELRAPVAAIQSYLRLILNDDMPPERYKEMAGQGKVMVETTPGIIDSPFEKYAPPGAAPQVRVSGAQSGIWDASLFLDWRLRA